MWPEALPPFIIIAACITATGLGLKYLDKYEYGGKVSYRKVHLGCCALFRKYFVYITAKTVWSRGVGWADDEERQENHRIRIQATGKQIASVFHVLMCMYVRACSLCNQTEQVEVICTLHELIFHQQFFYVQRKLEIWNAMLHNHNNWLAVNVLY